MLRLFESNEVNAPQALPGGPGVPQPLPQTGTHWDQDQVLTKSYVYHAKTSYRISFISMNCLIFSYMIFHCLKFDDKNQLEMA